MKRKNFLNGLLFGMAASVLVACSQEEDLLAGGIESGKAVFNFEASVAADTRTVFNADYSKLVWTAGDRLSLFTDAGDMLVPSNEYVEGNMFSAPLSESATKVYAFYPYELTGKYYFSNAFAYVEIGRRQVQQEAGVLNGANLPLYAEAPLSSDYTVLEFKPLASLLAFNVHGLGKGHGEVVKSVTFACDGSQMSGYYVTTLGVNDFDAGSSMCSATVGLLAPYSVPQAKPADKSGYIYLAVMPYVYQGANTFIVATDQNVYYFSMSGSLDLSDTNRIQTLSLDLSKAYKIEPLDDASSSFADAAFLQYLIGESDVNMDGKLSSFEAALLETVSYNGKSLKSLGGIEKLTGLKWLSCTGNELTELNFRNNTKLTDVYGFGNQITHVDVSNCPELRFLRVDDNQLTSLDVSKNAGLEYLWCDNNRLTTLDVSHNTKLQHLSCAENLLTALDVTNNAILHILTCSGNRLTSLDISRNLELGSLSCGQQDMPEGTVFKLFISSGQSVPSGGLSEEFERVVVD